MRTIPIKDRSQLERVYAALKTVEPAIPGVFRFGDHAEVYLLDKDMQATATLTDVAFFVVDDYVLQVIDGEITRVKGE